MEAEVLRLMREECEHRGVILLGPQASDVAGWSPDDVEPILDLVKHIQETYPLDPLRIAACGHADGVPCATQVVLKDRSLFRGLIASSGVYRGQFPENDPDFRLELLLTHFEDDESAPLVGRFETILQRMKYPTVRQQLHGDEPSGLTAEWAELITRWLDLLPRT